MIFKHKSWYVCSFYLWTLLCNGIIPLALANELELPLRMVSWESLSVWNIGLRHRGPLTSTSSEMEENEQETLSASFMLYLSEAFDDDGNIKKFHSIMSPLMKPVLYSLKQVNVKQYLSTHHKAVARGWGAVHCFWLDTLRLEYEWVWIRPRALGAWGFIGITGSRGHAGGILGYKDVSLK